EPVFEMDFGWDLIFDGHHALALDFDFFQTDRGTERWTEFESLVQTDRLDVGRYGISVGYVGSTRSRAGPPQDLQGPARMLRCSASIQASYRRQAFRRDEFLDFSTSPPTFIDEEVREDFDMVGGEAILDLEIGPRNIVAGFIRGHGGGGYVGVVNDGLEP